MIRLWRKRLKVGKAMKYTHGTIKGYLKDLGAKLPAPGGGSVAALSAAMAAGLISMVCQFTLGKEKYKKSQSRIKEILSRSQQLQKRLGELVDEDVKAYRSKNLEKAIKVPVEICFLSYDLMMLAEEVIDRGNRNLVSDAGLAALLSEASFISGLFYIKVNLKYLKTKIKKYEKLTAELKDLLKKIKKIRKKVEVKVGYFIGW